VFRSQIWDRRNSAENEWYTFTHLAPGGSRAALQFIKEAPFVNEIFTRVKRYRHSSAKSCLRAPRSVPRGAVGDALGAWLVKEVCRPGVVCGKEATLPHKNAETDAISACLIEMYQLPLSVLSAWCIYLDFSAFCQLETFWRLLTIIIKISTDDYTIGLNQWEFD